MDTEPKGLEASLHNLLNLHHHNSLLLAHQTGLFPFSSFPLSKLDFQFRFPIADINCSFFPIWGAEKAKKDAIRKAERVSDLLVEAVNGGVQDSFINQKRIELESRALASTITRFMKQTDQWLASTHALNTALKVLPCFHLYISMQYMPHHFFYQSMCYYICLNLRLMRWVFCNFVSVFIVFLVHLFLCCILRKAGILCSRWFVWIKKKM